METDLELTFSLQASTVCSLTVNSHTRAAVFVTSRVVLKAFIWRARVQSGTTLRQSQIGLSKRIEFCKDLLQKCYVKVTLQVIQLRKNW